VKRVFGALLLATAALPGTAQDLPTYSESAGTEYVMLPVVVLDRKGRFVEGLEKKDFRVKLQKAKEAILQIVRSRRPGDDFALFAFAEDEVRLVSDFSPDTRPLLKGLEELEASGQTALFDAVAATPKLMKGKNAKRAILLFTDGVDNASRLTATEMAEILQQVSTPVYPIGLKNAVYDLLTDQQRRELMVDNLRLLASSSGGKMFLVGDEQDLGSIAGKIDAEVREQYLLGFTPSGRGEVKYRVVIVSVAKPGRWTIRTRRGYRGTAPASGATLTIGKGGVS
jgi:VWFA-related protein